jgi:hypothetical protein
MSDGSLWILPLEEGDIETLTEVMTRSFDDDAQRHLGIDKAGPPGYDTGEFLRSYGLHPEARAFKALLDGTAVGAIIVFRRGHGRAVSNHGFYTRTCGFQKIAERDEAGGGVVVYQKRYESTAS